MKKTLGVLVISCLCILILGCQSNDETNKKEHQLSEDDLYDVYLLFNAPKATKKHDLTDVIKIVFADSDSSTGNTIAINVEGSKIYISPRISSLGICATKGEKQIDDMEKAIEILEKYNVQDWKEDYSFEDPSTYQDGYGWNLWLQFKDGTVESHKGSGSFADEITPENFTEFFNELNGFVNEHLDEDK